MAHEILSVKMYELDKKMQQVHSRIQLAEAMDVEKLRQQIGQIRQECEESQIILHNQLLHSRTECVMKLAKVYDEIENAVGRVLEAENMDIEKGKMLSGTEEKILTAEYALDFAMQAANRALLISLEAIAAQHQEDSENGKDKLSQ